MLLSVLVSLFSTNPLLKLLLLDFSSFFFLLFSFVLWLRLFLLYSIAVA